MFFRIFYKVKSRNAHMKSHSLKVLAEREANAVLRNVNTSNSTVNNSSLASSCPIGPTNVVGGFDPAAYRTDSGYDRISSVIGGSSSQSSSQLNISIP